MSHQRHGAYGFEHLFFRNEERRALFVSMDALRTSTRCATSSANDQGTCHKAPPSWVPSLGEGPFQVSDQIFGILQPNAQANERIGKPVLQAFLTWDARMCHARWVAQERFHPAQ